MTIRKIINAISRAIRLGLHRPDVYQRIIDHRQEDEQATRAQAMHAYRQLLRRLNTGAAIKPEEVDQLLAVLDIDPATAKVHQQAMADFDRASAIAATTQATYKTLLEAREALDIHTKATDGLERVVRIASAANDNTGRAWEEVQRLTRTYDELFAQ